MSGPVSGEVWVFHRGALGDSVLLWPRLRAEQRAGHRVVLVTDGEKALLAQRELGVTGMDAERPRFNTLWRDDARVEPVTGVVRVLCAGGGGDAAGIWVRNVRRMFPGAEIEMIGRPSRLLYRGVDAAAEVAVRRNPHGRVVIHIGAGSEEKRWGIDRWAEVVGQWHRAGLGVQVIAGEVELERLPSADRALFSRLGGRFMADLPSLADAIASAAAFVGCDSGPAHLAAAMGVPTLALFGPTDPEVWGPIGPAVRIVAPPSPRRMEWLEPRSVLEAAEGVVPRGMRSESPPER